MKIILCLHHFLPDVVGGTEIYTFRLAQALQNAGHSVRVVVPFFHSSVTEWYTHNNIKVIKYAENSTEDRRMILGKTKPEGVKEFVRIVQEEQADLVHFHELAPGMGLNTYHVEAIHLLGIPIVITLHVPLYTCLKGTLVYKHQEQCDGRIIIERCTACIYQSKNISGIKGSLLNVVSRTLFNWNINPTQLDTRVGTALGFPFVIAKLKATIQHLSHLSDKMVILADWYRSILISNGLAADKLVTIKQEQITSRAIEANINIEIQLPLKIVFLGRITKLKGLHLLIEAVVRIPENKISLHIYGQESEAAYVAECKELSAYSSNIFWSRAIPADEVISTLAKYHVLCLPSAFEMNPLVIQEAFAAGLPVLVSSVYGNMEQVQEGVNGWLFRFNDSGHLYEKLNQLVSDTRLVTAAQNSLPVVGSFEEVADRHLMMYSEILAKKKLLENPLPHHP